jgi:hypothetical protein
MSVDLIDSNLDKLDVYFALPGQPVNRRRVTCVAWTIGLLNRGPSSKFIRNGVMRSQFRLHGRVAQLCSVISKECNLAGCVIDSWPFRLYTLGCRPKDLSRRQLLVFDRCQVGTTVRRRDNRSIGRSRHRQQNARAPVCVIGSFWRPSNIKLLHFTTRIRTGACVRRIIVTPSHVYDAAAESRTVGNGYNHRFA